MQTLLLALSCLLLFRWGSCFSCPDGVARLVGRAEGKPETMYAQPASFGSKIGHKLHHPSPMLISDPPDACSGEGVQGVLGAVALSMRGNCSFLEKALALQAAGALAVVISNNKSMLEDGVPCIGAGDQDTGTENVVIPVMAVSWTSGLQLTEIASKGGTVTMTLATSHPWVSSVLMWMIAVGTVLTGSVWSGADFVEGRNAKNRRALLSSSSDDDVSTAGARGQAVVIDEKTALCMVAGASITLLVLYLVLNKVVYTILLALFVFSSIQALGVLIFALFSKIAPQWGTKTVQLWACGHIPWSQLSAFLLSTVVCLVWAFFRHAYGAWVVQDIIGVSLLILGLRVIRIPSLKTGTIMLSLFLLYDIFWVFLQPMITPGKKSVMVEVATARGMDEVMPMVFVVPSIWDSGLGEYSFLGYGDVLMPGLMVAYSRRLDIGMEKGLLNGYFLYTSLSYGAGIIITYCAQLLRIGGGRGQPALLYLVPCILGTIYLLSFLRSEVCLLLNHKQKDEDSDAALSDEDTGGANADAP